MNIRLVTGVAVLALLAACGRPEPSPEKTAQLRAFYRGVGLGDAFVSQVVGTPYDKIWHPSHAELLAAGVLTRVMQYREASHSRSGPVPLLALQPTQQRR